MTSLSRDAILAAEDLPRVPVEVPEWGGTVYVRTITGEERDVFEVFWHNNKDRRNVRAYLAMLSCVDETGAEIFKSTDLDAIGKKNGRALDRIFEVSMRLSRLGPQAVEELQGNSEASPSADSASDSRPISG
jgi:hypothetical protein